ncbi:hypothetical protein J5N97_015240 [Dioscorea zingiberensis]|uniref:Uncharacterized protein n=1 Tax=Dioscorea zingiberensis TaxID=325984 RepID=A0A9D5CUB6_9LILI|nr:hypothetical protein J5N97_015240 [Dioscorea zingiberensis]
MTALTTGRQPGMWIWIIQRLISDTFTHRSNYGRTFNPGLERDVWHYRGDGRVGRGRGTSKGQLGHIVSHQNSELVPASRSSRESSLRGRGGGYRHVAKESRLDSNPDFGFQHEDEEQPDRAQELGMELLSSVPLGKKRTGIQSSATDTPRNIGSTENDQLNHDHQALVLYVSENLDYSRDQDHRDAEFLDAEEPPDPGDASFSGTGARLEEGEPPDPGDSMQLDKAQFLGSESYGSKITAADGNHVQKKGRIEMAAKNLSSQ